jgi:hypothetical protein
MNGDRGASILGAGPLGARLYSVKSIEAISLFLVSNERAYRVISNDIEFTLIGLKFK